MRQWFTEIDIKVQMKKLNFFYKNKHFKKICKANIENLIQGKDMIQSKEMIIIGKYLFLVCSIMG